MAQKINRSQVGAGLPKLIQGGLDGSWSSTGDGTANNFTITFPQAFDGTPLFLAMPHRSADNGTFTCKTISLSNTAAVVRLVQVGAGNWSSVGVRWLAIELET